MASGNILYTEATVSGHWKYNLHTVNCRRHPEALFMAPTIV